MTVIEDINPTAEVAPGPPTQVPAVLATPSAASALPPSQASEALGTEEEPTATTMEVKDTTEVHENNSLSFVVIENSSSSEDHNNGYATNSPPPPPPPPQQQLAQQQQGQEIQQEEVDQVSPSSSLEQTSPIAAAAAANDADDADDVSSWTQSERDELCCLQLRFSFQNEEFSSFYMDLCKAGWKYDTGKQMYLPPDAVANNKNNNSSNYNIDQIDDQTTTDNTDDQQFLTAKEIQQHLDYYSLAGTTLCDLQQLHSKTNGKKGGGIPRLAIGQEERWRKLRDDVTFEHYKRRLKNTNSRLGEDMMAASKEEEQQEEEGRTRKRNRNKTTIPNAPTTKRQQPARKARNHHQSSSVTEADRGAGMYLNKTQIQAKEKARRKSLNAIKQQRHLAAISNQQPQQQEEEDEDLPFERLSLEECIAMGVDEDWVEDNDIPQEVEARVDKAQFKEWRFLLATNHSLLLYGFGSKRQLLNLFADKELSKEGYALVLDGYDPEISVGAILDLLVQVFLDDKEPEPLTPYVPGYEDEESTKIYVIQKGNDGRGFQQYTTRRKIRDPIQRAKAIARAIVVAAANQTLLPIFLVVHNIEGFRNRLDQEVLSTLVEFGKTLEDNGNIPVLRLVASMDHVDTPAMLWNERTTTQFRWMWKQVHTHRPYGDELIMLAPDEINTTSSKNKRGRSSSSGAAGGRGTASRKGGPVEGKGGDRLVEVLNSLAARYTEVMQNLATIQLQQQQHPGNNNNKWIEFGQLLSKCLEKCTVKNENQLRIFLVELEEQDLMAVQKQGSTATNVRIPYSEEKLHEILALQRTKS